MIARSRQNRGSALVAAIFVLGIVVIASVAFLNNSTASIKIARRQSLEIQGVGLADAGIDTVLYNLWAPFHSTQSFVALDNATAGATSSSPGAAVTNSIAGVGHYTAGVIATSAPDSYTRNVTVRSIGWIDLAGSGDYSSGDPQKTVDVTATYKIARSAVFDYMYFINNYGWMNGFSSTNLIVNGDMRSNGNFDYTSGLPTVNGSAYAAVNEQLSPAAAGYVNTPPVKWTDSTYTTNEMASSSNKANNQARWRQPYASTSYGAYGGTTYQSYRDILFDSVATIVANQIAGAIVGDANGLRSWVRTTSGATPSFTTLDTVSSGQVLMPDLSNISYYQALSSSYVDKMATYADGTANPNYGKGASIQTWNSSLNKGVGGYQTLSTSGQVAGSVVVTGTSAHPILIHGPITVSQDCVISGTVSGQGVIYTGRNVHIIGSLVYKKPPSFLGTDPVAIDNNNQKSDVIGLAAEGSIILGDSTTFSSRAPLKYMTPPFTKSRTDIYGSTIPAYNANNTDSTGRKLYQSVISDSTLHAAASSVNQVDAVMYTNNCLGGMVSTASGGVIFNGSIISKDEAIVANSLPMYMNYDTRIMERTLTQAPLIDINLPRAPELTRNSWTDRGFTWKS